MPDEDLHWADAFSKPGTWVGVSTEVPAWVGSLTRSESVDGATWAAEALMLDVSEMSEGERSAWGKGDGFPAFCTRFRVLADCFGGRHEARSFRNNQSLEERHEIRYHGEAVDL